MNLKSLTLITGSLFVGNAFAQTAAMPAARAHVKMEGGQAVKYTSKLAQVVELNFTFGNDHPLGKAIISQSLDRIAKSYAVGGKDAFTVRKITSGGGGVEKVAPAFNLNDLLSGEVIVANNIGTFGDATLGTAKQSAIQRAIETDGRGYLGFHGSGDNRASGWAWFTNQLHPVNYASHGARTSGPVYKHLAEEKHIVLQGILETNTVTAQVPNELDAGGNEVLAAGVKTRGMKNEWYRFGRDITRDEGYKDRVTTLLKYDPRQLGDALPAQFRRKGGNVYTWLMKVGQGTTSYIPAGHENDELLAPATGFDGGAGDYDRYVAQTLFFLAGYTKGPCDASCNGLQVVTAENRLTGQPYTSTGILDPRKMAFVSPTDQKFEAKVTDVTGRVVAAKTGFGKVSHAFDPSGLKAGVYFMSVRIGSSPAKIRKYAIAPTAR